MYLSYPKYLWFWVFFYLLYFQSSKSRILRNSLIFSLLLQDLHFITRYFTILYLKDSNVRCHNKACKASFLYSFRSMIPNISISNSLFQVNSLSRLIHLLLANFLSNVLFFDLWTLIVKRAFRCLFVIIPYLFDVILSYFLVK